MPEHKVEFASLPWLFPIPGVRCKTALQGGRQLRFVEYSPAMAPHWCEKDHIGYILEGEFEIRFDRETVILRAGDGVFLPPGREHRHMARALTDVVKVVFVEEA